MKKLFFTLLIMFLAGTAVLASEVPADKPVLKSQMGKVVSVETFAPEKSAVDGKMTQQRQSVEVEIISGEHKGEKVIVENMIMGNPAYDIDLHEGDKVILHAELANGGIDYFIADKYRAGVLYLLSGLFCLLLVIIGRKKGLFSLMSIAVTLGLIFWALTPMILSGFNPILSAVLVCVAASIIAIYLVGGFNRKSTAAILGTVLSLSIAGGLSVAVIKLADLTGFSSEESLFLFSAHPDLSFKGTLAAAMIIGALGAVMDIGMSISSTINELYLNNAELKMRELFNSGMNVGQDIIGTMANTLILAYLGGALSLVLLSDNIDMQKFFSLNQVATEISSALIGSIAIVLCVPISALIAAYLVRKNPPKEVEKNDFSDII